MLPLPHRPVQNLRFIVLALGLVLTLLPGLRAQQGPNQAEQGGGWYYEPESQTVSVGQSVTFYGEYIPYLGEQSIIGYHWYFGSPSDYTDIEDLPGTVGFARLTIANAMPANAGSYYLVANCSTSGPPGSNYDTDTSAVVTLTVIPVAATPAQQVIVPGQASTFTAYAPTLTGATYQWTFNGSAIAGATSSILTIPNPGLGQAGSYNVVASYSGGPATSTAALLEMAPSITANPQSQTVYSGLPATFSAGASGFPAPSYQWTYNGSILAGATSSVYLIANTVAGEAGLYAAVATNAAGSVSSAGAVLTVAQVQPTFTEQPASQTAAEGASVTFTAAASGYPSPTYQWSFDGTPLGGATSSALTIGYALPGNQGGYAVIASNGNGSATSTTATLTVTAPPFYLAPSVTVQPASQAVLAGNAVTLSVATTASPPAAYQWQFNGAAITGATSTTYVIASAAIGSNTGVYSVVASNPVGSTVSSGAVLSVFSPPQITGTTQNQIQQGVEVLSSTGNPSPTFQWSVNGSAISGATSTVYGYGTGGIYTVTASNLVGSTSANFTAQAVTDGWFNPISQTVGVGQPINLGQIYFMGAEGYYATGDVLYFNNAPITGPEYASLSSATTANTGTYYMEESYIDPYPGGATGINTSGSAYVTVVNTVTVTPAQQAATPGQPATFAATTTLSGASYQWSFNGSAIAGATSSILTVANPGYGNLGNYTALASSPGGSVSSAPALLAAVPSFTSNPQSQVASSGSSAGFSAVATGIPTPAYQWTLNGAVLAGATSSVYSIPSVAPANAGLYTVVAANPAGFVSSTSAVLSLTPVAPALTVSPTSASVIVPGTETFNTTVTAGLPAPTLQWAFNGTAIPGATSASYIASVTSLSNGGTYSVTASNAAGSATASATLTVETVPGFTSSPASQSVVAGTTATFTAAATGTPVPAYQWYEGVTAIPGATSPTYTTPVTTAAMNGNNYTVVATNAAGAATSTVVVLTVDSAPVITVPPASQSGVLAGSATFLVTASGVPAPTYQWSFGGTALADGTQADGSSVTGSKTASLTLGNLMATDTGGYTVTVSNVVGTPAAATATLSVSLPQGAFFGTFNGGGFALYVYPNGTGVLLGYDPTTGIVLSQTSFPVGANGQFSFSTNNGLSTVAGTATSTGVHFSVTGSGAPAGPFSGTLQTQSGTTSSLAGVYVDDQVQGSGVLQLIVGGNGTAYSLVQTSTGATSGTGTVSPSGSLSLTTYAGSTLAGTVGTGGTASTTLTGTGTSGAANYSGGSTLDLDQATVVDSISNATSAISSGNAVAIEGFVLAGTARPILVQGIGPGLSALSSLGASGPFLPTPTVALYGADGGTGGPLLSNTGWTTPPNSESAIVAAENSTSATPLSTTSADSAILTGPLAAGPYTAVVSGAGGASGTAVVEVYDTGSPPGQTLANTSTRGPIAAGGSLNHGFVIGGTVAARVLIRAVGPGLSGYGVPNCLAATTLKLYSGATPAGTLISSNTGWSSSGDAAAIQTAAAQAGAFSLGASSSGTPSLGDSAIIIALSPGSYTAVATSANGGTGTVLIEVYWLQ